MSVKDDRSYCTILLQLAPFVGASAGAASAMTNAATALNPTAAATSGMAGAAIGIGVAKSIGVVVARLELSSATLNEFVRVSGTTRNGQTDSARNETTGRNREDYSEDRFLKVKMVPHGEIYLRAAMLPEWNDDEGDHDSWLSFLPL